MSEESLFLAAIELLPGNERMEFLEKACAQDPAARERLLRLLAAHDQSAGVLEVVAPPDHADEAAYQATLIQNGNSAEMPGTIIAGRYKLREQIGEGGMGTVWVAEQIQPVRRKVALKLIKPGMDSKTVLSRFEAERQALAVMDHPNIAKVLDGGTTETGRPFFVMEYVKGIPFTRYCDEARLNIAERLALFVPVCQAIQHAHQKGIIHRDLKPGNILVCLYDGKPIPKVIDFGLAKAMHQPLTENSIYTAQGVMMGTPLYMSPEQAELNNLDVDTRTDIYSLGVILYELLTGTTPLEKQQFHQAAWHEMLRLIKEVEPPSPSARLSGSGTLPSLAAQRQLEPVKLTRLVRGELDWIVMKCLEKDRSRRYDTATGLARDVERYLADEIVEARPQSTAYRLNKFVRKNRIAIATISAFAGLLIAGIGISTAMAVRAKRAEVAAEKKRIEADENAAEAQRVTALYATSLDENIEARKETETRSASLQVDIGLEELKTNTIVGILKLARFLNTDSGSIAIPFEASSHQDEPARGRIDINLNETPMLKRLREFATMAVLANGQSFATLSTPFVCDGTAVAQSALNSTGERLLTRDRDHTVRLWNAFTGREIAVLKRANEKVIHTGFSPDGTCAFTDSVDGIVRLWETEDGKFRVETEPPLEPIKLIGVVHNVDPLQTLSQLANTKLSNDRILTSRFVRKYHSSTSSSDSQKTTELWDAKTGRRIARLDSDGERTGHFGNERCEFFGDGKWIFLQQDSENNLVLAAESGQAIGRIEVGLGTWPGDIRLSPSGRTAASIDHYYNNISVNCWDTKSWKSSSTTGQIYTDFRRFDAEMISDDLFVIFRFGEQGGIYRTGSAVAEIRLFGTVSLFEGGRFVCTSGQVFDTREWRWLQPPKGRKFHPDLVRFAPDGRFIPTKDRSLIDTVTEKSIPLRGFEYVLKETWLYHSGYGWVVRGADDDGASLFRLPLQSQLEIPSDLVELWAQVVVRGELDDDGRFVKWDDSTWEKKRQELASKPAPYHDFPFPGYVATDRWHWWRQEFESVPVKDQPELAQRILKRAEAAGDNVEAVRWIDFLAKNVIDSLSEKLFLRTEIEERVRLDSTLIDKIRAAAILKATKFTEDAYRLNRASWEIAARADATNDEYQRAIRYAVAAVKHAPEAWEYLNTLGVAQYRNGLYVDAIATLVKSNQAHQKREIGQDASNLAFLAMAHHALGEAEKANDNLRQLTALFEQQRWKDDKKANVFLQEARQRLAETP